MIGNILDVSDRLAYTARDAYMFAGSTILSSDFDRATPGRRVQEILQKNKLLFDTIMEISVQGDQIIFGNGEKLKDVLEIRANMHNLVYLSPYLWTREEYFGLLFQYLVEEGHLTIEQLQKGVNGQRLTINEEVINQFYQQGIIDHDPSVTYDFFDVQICDTAQQALAQLQELKLTMNPHLPIHYLKVPSFKPGTQYLTRSA
ncbi:MAG: hypothetical protein WCG98_03260 [bacterium]